MDRVEDFTECRLCSSKQNLLSFFSGKCRTIRNILRKLIFDVVKINIAPDDSLPKTVCLNCCIDVYNFYNFRMECIQNNENRYKDLDIKAYTTKPKKPKIDYVSVTDFKLPNQEEVKKCLAEWLAKKQTKIESDSYTTREKSVQDSPSIIDASTQTVAHSEHKLIQTDQIHTDPKKKTSRKSTQTQTVKTQDKSSQINHTKPFSHKSTVTEHTETLKTKVVEIQTEPTHVDSKLIQTNIKSITSRKHTQTPAVVNQDQCCQTDLVSTKVGYVSVQTEPVIPRDKNAQCDIIEHQKNNFNLKRHKIESVIRSLGKADTVSNQAIQCDLQKNNNVLSSITVRSTQTGSFIRTHRRSTQTDLMIPSENAYDLVNINMDTDLKNGEKLPILSAPPRKSRRISNSQKDGPGGKIFEEPPISNNKLVVALSKTTQTTIVTLNDQQLQTDIIPTMNQCMQCDIVPKTIITETKFPIKMDLKEEILSPIDCLHISTDTSFDSKILSSPKTPSTSDLLKIGDHNHPVKICRFCDKILYNKKEEVLHKKVHLQCNLCKKRFRSFKSTAEHMKECKLKHIEHKELYIEVVKLDTIPQYYEVFKKAINRLEEHICIETENP